MYVSSAASRLGGVRAMFSGPVAASIQRKLAEGLSPASLTVVNESHKHAGHSGNPSGAADAETHFRVEVVSAAFEGQGQVARHRLVYGLLAAEIEGGVHALALKTKTPTEVATPR